MRWRTRPWPRSLPDPAAGLHAPAGPPAARAAAEAFGALERARLRDRGGGAAPLCPRCRRAGGIRLRGAGRRLRPATQDVCRRAAAVGRPGLPLGRRGARARRRHGDAPAGPRRPPDARRPPTRTDAWPPARRRPGHRAGRRTRPGQRRDRAAGRRRLGVAGGRLRRRIGRSLQPQDGAILGRLALPRPLRRPATTRRPWGRPARGRLSHAGDSRA